MKHIRSALAAGLLVIGGAAVASAQQTNGTQAPQQHEHVQGANTQRGARGRGLGKQLYKGISLSADEKASIKNVHAKYAEQLKALRGKNLTAEQRAQAMQLRSAERNELRNALSPANRAKFDANAAQMKTRNQKRFGRDKQESGAAGQPPRA